MNESSGMLPYQGWDKLGKRLKGSYRTRFTFELIW